MLVRPSGHDLIVRITDLASIAYPRVSWIRLMITWCCKVSRPGYSRSQNRPTVPSTARRKILQSTANTLAACALLYLVKLGSTKAGLTETQTLFHDRNLDARPPSIPRDLTPLLLRLAHARLNVGSGSAGPAHPADHVGAVA